MDANCIFCKIIEKNIQSDILFENENVIVIKDLYPRAPIHLLVIAKQHIESVNELTENNSSLISDMVLTAKLQAKQFGIAESGFKLIWNVGKEGGQMIPHLHLHVLGGKQLME